MNPEASPEAKRYLAEIGRAGGKSGKGKKKARTTEQAAAAARARWKKLKNNSKGTKQ